MKTFTERKEHRVSTRKLILDLEKSLFASDKAEAEKQGRAFDIFGRQKHINKMEERKVWDFFTTLI